MIVIDDCQAEKKRRVARWPPSWGGGKRDAERELLLHELAAEGLHLRHRSLGFLDLLEFLRHELDTGVHEVADPDPGPTRPYAGAGPPARPASAGRGKSSSPRRKSGALRTRGGRRGVFFSVV